MSTPQEVYEYLTKYIEEGNGNPLLDWQILYVDPLVVARWLGSDHIQYIVADNLYIEGAQISEAGFPHEVRRFLLESEQR